MIPVIYYFQTETPPPRDCCHIMDPPWIGLATRTCVMTSSRFLHGGTMEFLFTLLSRKLAAKTRYIQCRLTPPEAVDLCWYLHGDYKLLGSFGGCARAWPLSLTRCIWCLPQALLKAVLMVGSAHTWSPSTQEAATRGSRVRGQPQMSVLC